MKIAFIGLGNMGGGMAANLVKAGHDVRAFDLSEAALEHARESGCTTFATAREWRLKAWRQLSRCCPTVRLWTLSIRQT
jgi:3-hydroxyisobutyrate dehydrogenase-like beta-hydroxyacid dehydrogenase